MGVDDSNDVIDREPSLPPIPRAVSGELQTALSAIREQLERISGKIGGASARAVRLRDLENGILSRYFTPSDASKAKKPGAGGSRVLKAPRNLRYEHLVFAIRLTWENVEEDYSHVEIWCATGSAVIDDAVMTGVATRPMAEWIHNGVSTRFDYTYWIRAVGWDGSVSPWCPPQGQGGLIVPAPIDNTIEEILDILIGNLTEDHLYQALNERIALIDGPPDLIGSVAQRLESLQKDIGAHITTVQTELEEADEITASRVDTVFAATDSALAAIQTEQTARINADEVAAEQVHALFAKTSDNAAAIQTEQATRATADAALASQTTQLQTDVAGVRASVVSEASSRSAADQALSTKLDKLTADLGTTNAAIQTEQTARVHADTALASTVTTLQTRVGANTASIQQAMQSIDGIEAMYFLKTNVQGHVAGFGLINSGISSNFIVLSDKFMVVAPGVTPKVPFVVGPVGQRGVYGVGIDGGLVVNGTIMAHHLDAGSVTADKIGAAQISAGHLAAHSVSTDKLAAGAVTADKISAGAITADMITAGKLDANLISQNGIPIDKIASGVVIAGGGGTTTVTVPSGGSGSLIFVSWFGRRVEVKSGDQTTVSPAAVTISGILSKTFEYRSLPDGWGESAAQGSWTQPVYSSGKITISQTGLAGFTSYVAYLTIK